MDLPIAAAVASANADGEFRIAARGWNTTLTIVSGDRAYGLAVRDGVMSETPPSHPSHTIAAGGDVWAEMLAPVPKPFYQDIFSARTWHGLELEGDEPNALFAYYPAVRRFVELMRAAAAGGV